MNIVYGIFIFVVCSIAILLIWRLLSQYINIPCPAWLYWCVEMDNPFAKACHAKIIVENLSLEPGMKVLDAGCGSGRVTIPIAEKIGPNGQVTAMDIQQGMLDVVQGKMRMHNVHNVCLLLAGLGENKLEHNVYDRAILVTVLGEIPNQRAALQEIYNALKKGGILSVSETIFDPHFQRKQSVIDVAKSVGFHEKKFFGNRCAYTIHFEK
jgi:ubiquinone/menaquinone biosynthesis C-methylase UbiE